MSLFRSSTSALRRSGSSQPTLCRAVASSAPAQAKNNRTIKPKPVNPQTPQPVSTQESAPQSAFAAYRQAAQAKAAASAAPTPAPPSSPKTTAFPTEQRTQPKPSSSAPTSTRKRNEPRYNYISNPFDDSPDPDASTYRLVTARDLATRTTPPRRVKMLARDFIDDCLYNPNYGYFSTQAVIFDPDEATGTRLESRGYSEKAGGETGVLGVARGPGRRAVKEGKQAEVASPDGVSLGRAEGFRFGEFGSTAQFEDEVARRYGAFEADGGEIGSVGKGPGRQVWHTPTELFKPWYGRAVARYLVAEYKLTLFPYSDLIIYEIGAGNGTLMGDILDYIAQEEPEVYERTRYRIIEISERLQGLQKGRASGGAQLGQGADGPASLGGPARRKGHADKVEVFGGGIFEWDKVVTEPCFFLAMEVLDNFAHDVVRYSTETHQPYQCFVSVDSTGDYTELYEPVTDPLIARYLSLRARTPTPRSPALNPVLDASPILRKIWSSMPFAPNLTKPEFIPTKQLMLLDVLKDKFPRHRMLMSDFSSLPDAIPGEMAPVVQTRYEGETVACTTYLVQPGFFDIFFPTDFHLMRDMYKLVMADKTVPAAPSPAPTGASTSSRLDSDFFSPQAKARSAKTELQVLDHAEFLSRYGEVEMTRVRDGTNPMVESYENAKFIL